MIDKAIQKKACHDAHVKFVTDKVGEAGVRL